jgi:hypothetical protein
MTYLAMALVTLCLAEEFRRKISSVTRRNNSGPSVCIDLALAGRVPALLLRQNS